jgi:hypothetical protein
MPAGPTFDYQASFMHVIYPHYASNSLSKTYSIYIIRDFKTSPSHLKQDTPEHASVRRKHLLPQPRPLHPLRQNPSINHPLLHHKTMPNSLHPSPNLPRHNPLNPQRSNARAPHPCSTRSRASTPLRLRRNRGSRPERRTRRVSNETHRVHLTQRNRHRHSPCPRGRRRAMGSRRRRSRARTRKERMGLPACPAHPTPPPKPAHGPHLHPPPSRISPGKSQSTEWNNPPSDLGGLLALLHPSLSARDVSHATASETDRVWDSV